MTTAGAHGVGMAMSPTGRGRDQFRQRGGSMNMSFPSVAEYVKHLEGTRVIEKVLIANNGISAVKAIRSIRRWAYEMFGYERKIQFLVMATPEDLRANAEYIRMADQVVEVPGGANNNNYANVLLIVELAERFEVDAVWAGWGHASENPLLPEALQQTERNIVFIGPPAGPMRGLGDKIGSTIIAQSAQVPTIAWNGDGITVDYAAHGGIPYEIYEKGMVKTAEDALAVCRRIGFPVMIKASEGGGGKGIRKVLREEDVVSGYEAVKGEVKGSPIFVMKLAPRSRHLEVQLLADTYGEAIALSGRDCSIQRRHQKIVEEGPVLAAPKDVWSSMERAAVRLAKEVGYVNAGTVEYLYTEKDEKFFFLELNPRLQVEHPVTEMITGINLPAAQLQVAMGIPLHRIPDIRMLYDEYPFASSRIDFHNTPQRPPHGHVIAARITAENPDAGFKPTSGAIEELNFRSTPDVWGYFSVDSSGRVHEFADSQIGHLFAWGDTRNRARKNIVLALKELSIRGDIRTTIEYIAELLESEDFEGNNISTSWLDKRIADRTGMGNGHKGNPLLVVVVGAAVSAFQAAMRKRGKFTAQLQRGQMPLSDLLVLSEDIELICEGVKYRLLTRQSGPNNFTIECNGSYVQTNVRKLNDGGYLVLYDGKSHVAYMMKEASGLRLVLDGQTCLFTNEYDPTSLSTDAAGKIARYLVKDGAHVMKGQPFAEIEVMKMLMPLLVPESGVITLKKSEGAALVPGDVLATVELDDPTCVKKSEEFSGALPSAASGVGGGKAKPHTVQRSALSTLELVMKGYNLPRPLYEEAVHNLFTAVKDPLLASYEVEEALSALAGRMPTDLYECFLRMVVECRESSQRRSSSVSQKAGTEETSFAEKQGKSAGKAAEKAETAKNVAGDELKEESARFPAASIVQMLDQHMQSLPEGEKATFMANTASLRAIAEKHAVGPEGAAVAAFTALVNEYLGVENFFASAGELTKEDLVSSLRAEHRNDMETVFDRLRSHRHLHQKNALLLALLRRMPLMLEEARRSTALSPSAQPEQGEVAEERERSSGFGSYVPLLQRLAGLLGKEYSLVALEARQLLLQHRTPSYLMRRVEVEKALKEAAGCAQVADREKVVKELIDQSQPVFDLLLPMFYHQDPAVRVAAIETYVRRIYRNHEVLAVSCREVGKNALESSHNSADSDPERSLPPSSSVNIVSVSQFLAATFEFRAFPTDALPVGMPDTGSYDDLSSLLTVRSSTNFGASGGSSSSSNNRRSSSSVDGSVVRYGVMASFQNLREFEQNLEAVLALFPSTATSTETAEALHVLHVSLVDGGDRNTKVQAMESLLAGHKKLLLQVGIRRVSFIVGPQGTGLSSARTAGVYTFRKRLQYREDTIIRHMEAPQAFQLELGRLSNYNVRLVPTGNRSVHIYEALPKNSAAGAAGLRGPLKPRYFVRSIVRTVDSVEDEMQLRSVYDAHPGPERAFVEALDALEMAMGEAQRSTDGGKLDVGNNHVFLSVLPDAVVHPDYVEAVFKILARRYEEKIRRLRVTEVEFRIIARFTPEAPKIPVRLLSCNPTGFVLRVDAYVETRDETSGKTIFTSVGDGGNLGELDGLPVDTPYPVIDPLQRYRELAASMSDTLYVYDFIELLEGALRSMWSRYAKARKHVRVSIPRRPLQAVELVLRRRAGKESSSASAFSSSSNSLWTAEEADDLELVEVVRQAGHNDVGMVAWVVTLYTPEFPPSSGGRRMVIIANDITHKAGSFGTREDLLFQRVSAYARKEGIPRVYIAANSGARIGVAEEVKARYQVAWIDAADPFKGFRYIYLSAQDYAELKDSVVAELRVEGGEERFVIKDIIGAGPDLGVENLRGSGAIAGETSRAFDEIFTLTYVAGRTVGIGAYLVRLGQRTIQKETGAPIILTGHQALNKLLGKPVYASNAQLGGIKIMHSNGVSHLTVSNHMEGMQEVLRWLSFVPASRGGALPIVDITGVDVVERDIEFIPPETPYDPREMLAGQKREDRWISGFFDKDSFHEYLSSWAKTVVVGRARLGGIPVGVIVSEMRTTEKVIPADPASPDTTEQVIQQAGQVWFPDSAHKTATAIRDFHGESLPLMIFANWRGFSGGQRDMFDEVLKFGSCIVDALVAYKQPVFVYIPPHGELRGGAWVVVDPSINSEVMEMFADEEGRGGVLEPSGTVEIKYRSRDLRAAAHRLDPKLTALRARIEVEADDEQRSLLSQVMADREEQLVAVYQQIATHFADLHDRPGRMKAKKVISDVVPWRRARSFFYWRLRRRLSELVILRKIKTALNTQEAAQELACPEDSRTMAASVAGNSFASSHTAANKSALGFSGSVATDAAAAHRKALSLLRTWFEADALTGKIRGGARLGEGPMDSSALWKDDRTALRWLTDERAGVEAKVEQLERESVAASVVKLGKRDPHAVVRGVMELLDQLDSEEREEVLGSLRRATIFRRRSELNQDRP